MESSILAALVGSALVACVVLLLSRAAAGPIALRHVVHQGRLRLPVRAFERAVVIAVVASTAAIVPAFAGTDAGVGAGAATVVAVVVWCARRGVFLPPRNDGDDDTSAGGAP